MTTGFLFKLANGIISWQSRAQKTIALSATEAEYMALSDCSRQAVWIQNIFSELGLPIKPTQICADNEHQEKPIWLQRHPGAPRAA